MATKTINDYTSKSAPATDDEFLLQESGAGSYKKATRQQALFKDNTISQVAASDLTTLSQSISSPPTQAEVQAIQSRVNDLVTQQNTTKNRLNTLIAAMQ